MHTIDPGERRCIILDEFSVSDRVAYEPAEYWYLDLYIIVLDDIDGALSSSEQKYMVLEYPSYSENRGKNQINDCIWSTPYMAYLFQKPGTKRFRSVGEIMNFYKEQITLNKELLSKLEDYRFYHMGIPYYEMVPGNHYVEYKRSPRQPDKWKCYYIQEHFVHRIDSLGLLNLCDPEGLHGYRYFPLLPRPNVAHDSVYFASKHLASNVTQLLRNSYNKMLQHSNEVTLETLRYDLYGIAFKFDIVGFTMMYNKIVSEMQSLDETGKEIAVHFIAGLSSIFERNMQKFGISQYSIEGDGVTGTLPLKDSSKSDYVIKTILTCICSIKEDINKFANKLGTKIQVRCSILEGDYFYGKLAGLASTHQAAGEIFISLSRMDQYLQDAIKYYTDLPPKSIILCISNEIANKSTELLSNFDFYMKDSKAKFRETNINATVYYKEV